MSENPYASPSYDVIRESGSPSRKITRATVLGSLLTWIVVCSISAIPSFILGSVVSESELKYLAMSLGILLFAVAYTALDLNYLRDRIGRNPALRRTVFTGYSTRIVASIIFPAGLMIDMWFGFLSVGIVRGLASAVAGVEDSSSAALSGFVEILLATLIQGCFLNAFLFGFMALAYGVFVLLGMPTERPIHQDNCNDGRVEKKDSPDDGDDHSACDHDDKSTANKGATNKGATHSVVN